ncbi:MAG: hypothetical protein WAO35_24925 [Terriglobia bacterium]
MSLRDWVQYGWLTEHQSSREEIENLLGVVDRDLRECQAQGLGADWRFAIAYNAALQAATAALAAAGFHSTRDSHHYRVFQSLEHTIEAEQKRIYRLDAFRKKRNLSSYEQGGTVSEEEAKEMAAESTELRREVERWIRAEHPELL